MGQYYRAFIHNVKEKKVFSPRSSLYLTAHGLDEMPDVPYGRFEDPDSYAALSSGLKLTEHSWMGNRFVNGVIEEIQGNPSNVAWVGDYADEEEDFNRLYTRQDYEKVWGEDSIKESRFKKMPDVHEEGYLLNHTKGHYLDLSEHMRLNEKNGWCIHPLPLLTAIGNGRGGGDYRGYNMDMLGAWAMDVIEYSQENPGWREVRFLFDSEA